MNICKSFYILLNYNVIGHAIMFSNEQEKMKR